ncbi:MAG TPA: DUF4337 family protein [Rhodopila sp.]|nr:DUF4337 family protein [Rhodopila sp.]
MSEALERAHETMEHHEHGHGHEQADPWSRRVAVLVSALAAALAITGIAGNAAQNEYLTHHIAVSDEWSYYQAKNLRAVMAESELQVLSSLPNAAEPAIQSRIKAARANVERLRDDPAGGKGMKQLAQQARAEESIRNEARHRYHNYEYASGALEIAIVLASVSVVTRMRALAFAAAGIGALASLAAGAVALDIF